MSSEVIRQQLHKYIDTADEKKLQAIYTLVESEIGIYDDATLNMLNETSEEYHSGKMKGYSIEESIENIRRQTQKIKSEDLDMLHERAEEYLRGEAITYTIEEAHKKIRGQRKARS